MNKLVVALLVVIASAGTTLANASNKLLALYIYNFALNTQWETQADGQFTIAVLNDPGVARELKVVTNGKHLHGQPIQIVEYYAVEDITTCSVIYMEGGKETFHRVARALAGRPTLMITHAPDLAMEGSAINFSTRDGKLRFEVNQSSLKRNGLTLQNEIAKLGIQVDTMKHPGSTRITNTD